MGRSINIRIDESLRDILSKIQKDIAIDMKRQYNLNEITIQGTLASQVAAAKLRGNTILNFKIRKTGINTGVLELIA